MKYIYSVCLLFTFVLLFSGCKKDDSNPAATNQYSNKLTLGTGMDYTKFAIIGEGTSFTRVSGVATIYWRLESENDMAGSAVRIKVEKLVSGSYTTFYSVDVPSTQSYGHIMMSAIGINEAGTFKVTGILVNGTVTIASQVITVI